MTTHNSAEMAPAPQRSGGVSLRGRPSGAQANNRHPHVTQERHWKKCPCPECMRKRDDRTMRWVIVASIALAAVAFFFMGCSSTVTPAPVESRQASFDQGEQNSGVLALVPGGALITPRARDRYNALVAIYGREFLPPLVADEGVTREADGNFRITNEALQKFILMNAWRRMGREPGKTRD